MTDHDPLRFGSFRDQLGWAQERFAGKSLAAKTRLIHLILRSVSRTYFKTWSYFTYQRGARLITGRRLTLLPRRPIAEDGSVQKVQEVAGEYQVR